MKSARLLFAAEGPKGSFGTMDYQRANKVLFYGNSKAHQTSLDYLTDLGSDVVFAETINEAKKQVYGELADVLIMDLDSVGEVGLSLCRRLKNDPLTYNKPIIIAMASMSNALELAAIDAGADDFCLSSVKPPLLAGRMEKIISRSNRLQMSNPLTGLPGNLAIEEHLKWRIEQEMPLAVAYVDLDNFKVFNDKYGYSRGDNVIRLTAMIIKEAVQNYGSSDDFYGHVGGDDFIMVTDWECLEAVCNHVIKSFDTLVPFQYDEEDQRHGYILAVSRQNEENQFPIITLSIGVVTNRHRNLLNPIQISDLATEMKRYAKQFSKSTFVVDRRKDSEEKESAQEKAG